MDCADGNHNRIERMILARDDGLQGENGTGRDHHRVNGVLSTPTVAAHSEDRNVHGVGCGQRIPRSVAHLSDRLVSTVMNGQGEIGFGKAREQAVFDHGSRSLACLFRWLAYEYPSAVPAMPIRRP